MSLRRQLLLASILLLTLPWAGCQFVLEMEGALRQGQEQALQATATAVAAVLKDKPELLYPYPQRLREQASANSGRNRSVYATPVSQAIIVDGYGDGWEDIPFQHFESSGDSNALVVRSKAATRGDRLFLFLAVTDDDVVFHNPTVSREPNGDRLILRTWLDGRRQEFVIATSAPGAVSAQYNEKIYSRGSARRIRGQWQDTLEGYNLELEIPLSLTGGRLGFYIVNVNGSSAGKLNTLGNVSPLDMAPPPWLIFAPAALQDALLPFAAHNRQLQVVDKTRWVLADISSPGTGGTQTDTSGSETFWLVRALYRSILAPGTPLATPPPVTAGKLAGEEITAAISGATHSHWYQNPEDAGRTLLSASAPIYNQGQVIGAVVLRQGSEEYLSLTDQAFGQLLGYSLLALGIGVLGLLVFASVLSWRIRRLAQAASTIVRDDGSLGRDFPVSKAPDEIGDLSRRYGQMLEKLREYHDYLRTLSRKLTHELRTPIAVIQTSLENLEHQHAADENSAIYIGRAREGLGRLNKILTAMSEANRLEESIHNNSPRETNLVPLVKEVFSAYQGLYPRHRLKLKCDLTSARTEAVPELIVQALDKLMENAASFSPANGTIVLALQKAEGSLALSVSNTGPPLPDELQNRLFDSMVSLREGDSGDVHLGLGLFIVRLVAEFHGGSVRAKNLLNNIGASFTIYLPWGNPETGSTPT